MRKNYFFQHYDKSSLCLSTPLFFIKNVVSETNFIISDEF